MTQSKGLRLIQELIKKYGDVELIQIYDYYATRIYSDINNIRSDKNPEDVIIGSIKLSDLEGVSNRDEYKLIEQIASGKQHKIMRGVEVEESKKIYESPEQVMIRKKHSQDFHAMMGNFMGIGSPFHIYDYIRKPDMMLDMKTSPKEFGMAMSNSHKYLNKGGKR